MNRMRTRGLRGAITVSVMLLAGLLLTQVSLSQEYGSNWFAEYYDNRNLSGSPVATATVSRIDFNFEDDAPVDQVDDDDFSIRFTSTQTFLAGTYEFTAESDDGVRVYIDGVLVLDRFIGRPLTTDRVTRNMTDGAHSIVVEYFEGIDNAIIRFYWIQLDSVAQTGTPTATFGPSPTPLPTATATPIPATGIPPVPPGAIIGTIIRGPVVIARSAPSINASEVTRVLRGQQYAVVGESDDWRWFLLQMSGFQAWVFTDYVHIYPEDAQPPMVSGFVLLGNPGAISGVVAQALVRLNIRAQPTMESEKLGQLGIGDVAAVVARNGAGDWYQVQYGDVNGWVAAEWTRIVEGDVWSVPAVP